MSKNNRTLKGNTLFLPPHGHVLIFAQCPSPLRKTEINLCSNKNVVVVNFDFLFFFSFLVAIRATSAAGQPYFIVDMADLWLQMKKRKKNPESKCSHMLRTCRGYRNEDNDLKCMAAALKSLSHESQRESELKMKLHLHYRNRGLISASPVYLGCTSSLCVSSSER